MYREASNTSVIYSFPAKPRIAANRIAEQMRRMKEIEASRSEDVVSTTSWYHEAAVAEDRTKDRKDRRA